MNEYAYNHKTAFGAWINDMRNQARPNENWPYVVLDDQTVEDIIGCLELQSQAGFNEFDVFGLLVSHSWPLDIVSAVDEDRRRKVNQILKAAHEREVKVLYGLGVYSWGFDQIIENCPEARGTNPHAMCGSKEESWPWMKKVVDFILNEFEVDGFHLESSDQGRCKCNLCEKQSDVEYHCGLNQRTAEYVRSQWPDKVLMMNMCGYIPWGKRVPAEDVKHLLELGKHLDFLIDPGHRGHFIAENSRRDFVQALPCDFGTSAGTWVYPPQRWDRLRWFLPYMMRTGKHIKQLYEDGGRAIEYYMGPTLNPGVEVNIAFGGKLLSNVGREIDEVLTEVIETLYQPKSVSTCDKLVEVFQRAESAYFDQWSDERIVEAHKCPAPGELHLTSLFGTSPGPASYLTEPFLDSRGRVAYKRELLSILEDISKIEGSVGVKDRVERIKMCIRNAINDID
jgi:hypothetical protein